MMKNKKLGDNVHVVGWLVIDRRMLIVVVDGESLFGAYVYARVTVVIFPNITTVFPSMMAIRPRPSHALNVSTTNG